MKNFGFPFPWKENDFDNMSDTDVKAAKIPTKSLIENSLENSSSSEKEAISNSEDVVSISPSCHGSCSSQNDKQTFCSFFGIGLAILSSLMLVLMNLFAKLCTVLPVLEIGVVRFLIQLAITIPLLINDNDKIVFAPKIMTLLILRGFTGTSGMLTRLYAMQNMPLGDATVLMFTTPIFVAIFGRIFLKEPLHRIYIFLLFLCLVGVTLIARPTFIFGHPDTSPEYENIWLPSLIAVASCVCAASSFVAVKVLVRYSIKSSVIIFYFAIVGLVYSICGSYFDRGFQFPFCQSIDYLFAILVGIFAYLVQAALNAALKFEKAFIIALGLNSGIVIGFIVQLLVFALIPSALSFGGAALITLSNLIIFLFKWKKSKKKEKIDV